MLSFHKKYAKNIFSQTGEDGILEEVLARLNIKTGLVVEFGAHDGTFCSNSRNLIKKGWKAILMESNPDLYLKCRAEYKNTPGVAVGCEFMTPSNINMFIPYADVLSIDVDGIDAAIWDAYTGDGKVVIIEINSSLPPLSDTYADPQLGTSYKMMWRLGLSKGYFLLSHSGNMIFVKSGFEYLFPELIAPINSSDRLYYHPLKDIDMFFDTSWQK